MLTRKIANKKFVFSRFLTSTISFSILHTSLICCVLIPYFKDSGMLPLQISVIIVSKRVLRLFCDTIFGLIFDIFGAKVVFIIGRVLKLLSYLMLLKFPNFYGFIIAMLLDGASYSSIYGKVNSYIYNSLSLAKRLSSFPKAMSLYYFCMDASIATMSFLAGVLLKQHGYDFLIYISIITNIFSIFLLIKYVPKASDERYKKFKAKSAKDVVLKVKDIFCLNRKFRGLVLLYGINSFLAWQFHSISSMILLDMKFSATDLAFCGGGLKITMGIGAIISLIFFKNSITIKQCIYSIFIFLIFGIVSAIIYNPVIFYIFCLFIVISYTTIEVAVEKSFEFQSEKTIRGTAISLAMTFCSLLAIISNIVVGFVAQYFNYRVSLLILLIILLLLIFRIGVSLKEE